MGKVSFKYGTASQLTNAPYSEGTFYVISDNGSTDGILYADLNNKRICFGDVASLEDDVSELSSSIPTKISELIDDSDFIKQYYGTCETAAATVQKEVTIDSITELTTGLTIFVKFTYANTAANPTLKLNDFDTKYIKRYGTTAPSTSAASSWNAGGIVSLTYDGTYWYLNDWNNTTYSALSESEMKTGTATTGRNITAARLKHAVEYHAPVSSVNGQTGEVSINIPIVPTNVSDFTNDSNYITANYLNNNNYKKTHIVTVTTDENDNLVIDTTYQNISNWFDAGDFVVLYNETDYFYPNSPYVDLFINQKGQSYQLTGNGIYFNENNYVLNDDPSYITLNDGEDGAQFTKVDYKDLNNKASINLFAATYNGNATNSISFDTNHVSWYGSPTADQDLTNKVYVDTAISGLISQETDPTVPSWAKASTKPSYNFSEIGSTPTTISGYGITDAYTKTQVDGLVAGVLHYKGTKAAVSNLPTSGNTTGDTWHVTADGSEWAWDGTVWQELGTAVDLSDYVTTDDSRLSDARTPTAHNQALSTITGADDLKAIEALSGTSGLLKKTAANTWTLDSSNYLTSYTETDPVFSTSAAAGITSTDISNWNAKVSDDKTWNSVSLAKQQTTNTGDDTYVPLATSTSPVNMSFTPVKKTPTANAITKYDSSAYLYSTTPSANDNSTKVATTAYVDAAIPQVYSSINTSGYLTMATLPIYDGTVV